MQIHRPSALSRLVTVSYPHLGTRKPCGESGTKTLLGLEITDVLKVTFGDFNICFTAAVPCLGQMVINEGVTCNSFSVFLNILFLRKLMLL